MQCLRASSLQHHLRYELRFLVADTEAFQYLYCTVIYAILFANVKSQPLLLFFAVQVLLWILQMRCDYVLFKETGLVSGLKTHCNLQMKHTPTK